MTLPARREIWWLNVGGTRHRAVIIRAEVDRIFAVWGQTVPGDANDVVVKLGAHNARPFRIDRDTHFRLENVAFYKPEDFPSKLGECDFRLFGRFEHLANLRLRQLEEEAKAAAEKAAAAAKALTDEPTKT